MELPDPSLKYDLPAELLTKERLEAAALEQRRLAEVVNSPYSGKSPQDIQRFNAGIVVRETEAMLLAIPLKKLSQPTREQYAEALAEIGHFEHAAKVTKNKDRRKDYKSIWKAILKDDTERCKCLKTDFNGVRKNNLFAELEVWSLKHGRRMPLIRCNICGHRNVKNLPESIAKEREIRQRNRRFVSGKTHDDAKSILIDLMK